MQINGWTLVAHPAFSEPYSKLVAEVGRLQHKGTKNFHEHPKTKLLARIQDLIATTIPKNPNAPEFLQGNTLGATNRHWRRAKFFQRFRLFFRFSSTSKIIVYAWVNDENTLRQAGSETDPYEVFKKRLTNGNPPSDWDELLAECHSLSLSGKTAKADINTKAKLAHSCKKSKR